MKPWDFHLVVIFILCHLSQNRGGSGLEFLLGRYWDVFLTGKGLFLSFDVGDVMTWRLLQESPYGEQVLGLFIWERE